MSLSEKVKTIWNNNAAHWNEKMGEGNRFHKELIEPNNEGNHHQKFYSSIPAALVVRMRKVK